MDIRKAVKEDTERIMEIYASARKFMADNGNPRQWGDTCWPPQSLIEKDIAEGKCRLCIKDGKTVGVFYYDFGKDIDKTYLPTDKVSWSLDKPYGVVHRIASDGTKGVGTFCITEMLKKCGYLRMDTYSENRVMLNLLKKLGFHHCGTIYVEEDDLPRCAFDKIQ